MPSPKSQSRYSNGSLLRGSTGSALRRGDIKISDPIPYNQDGRPPSTTNELKYASASAPSRHTAVDWPIKNSPPNVQRGRHFSTGNLEPGDAGRASIGPSLVPSSMSTEPSKASSSQKKSGGFRATLRRMFGSKRGRESTDDHIKEYYASDPGNLTSIIERSPAPQVTQVPTQSSDRVTRASALGSHFPSHLNENVPEFSPNPSTIRSQHQRRNTLPSLVLTDPLVQILAGPADDDLISKQWKHSVPPQGYLKRRSRSADALNRMISDFSLEEASSRDRQSEIAYWRKSIVDNPVPALHSWEHWQESNADEAQPSSTTENRASKLAPIETFDFGLDRHRGEAETLEERVNTLEVKIVDFEFALASLQGHRQPSKMHKRRSIHELFPDSANSGVSSSSSSHEPRSFLASPDESPIVQGDHEESFRPDRSSKATTIRPLTAHRRSGAASPSPIRITVDQFDRIMDIIRREQNARRQLESQVTDLQKELEALRSPVYAEIRPAYPTPSPESAHVTPVAMRGLRRSPPFQKDKLKPESSRFSMSELDSDTDDPYQEIYETPNENTFTFEKQPGRSPVIGVR